MVRLKFGCDRGRIGTSEHQSFGGGGRSYLGSLSWDLSLLLKAAEPADSVVTGTSIARSTPASDLRLVKNRAGVLFTGLRGGHSTDRKLGTEFARVSVLELLRSKSSYWESRLC